MELPGSAAFDADAVIAVARPFAIGADTRSACGGWAADEQFDRLRALGGTRT